MSSEVILQVADLKMYFQNRSVVGQSRGLVYAVDGVSLAIDHGECLGLVGESGCGKTTLGRCIIGLEKPTAGEVLYRNADILSMKRKEMKEIHSKIQVVFQDPYASLNPRWLVRDIIAEPLVVSGKMKHSEIRNRVVELLGLVGLNPDHMYRFPHEFSGGQRQRIAIARALSVNPEFIILDEPTSSLDVSVQAQILNLLKDLQNKLDLTYLFISHNLSVIKHMATRIAVMYLGRIVELGKTEEIFNSPLHPYTQALLKAVPVPDPDVARDELPVLGDVPDPSNPPPGCYFNPRCPHAVEKCRTEYPELVEYTPGHFASCHLANTFIQK